MLEDVLFMISAGLSRSYHSPAYREHFFYMLPVLALKFNHFIFANQFDLLRVKHGKRVNKLQDLLKITQNFVYGCKRDLLTGLNEFYKFSIQPTLPHMSCLKPTKYPFCSEKDTSL